MTIPLILRLDGEQAVHVESDINAVVHQLLRSLEVNVGCEGNAVEVESRDAVQETPPTADQLTISRLVELLDKSERRNEKLEAEIERLKAELSTLK